MELKNRKPTRLKEFDYSTQTAYFLTLCSNDRKCIFSEIVGDGAPDVPKINLTEYGLIIQNEINKMNEVYNNLKVPSYIIMPNHIHLMLVISESQDNGTSRAPSPTNSVVAKYVSTLKRITNKKCNAKIWQRSYYDHIIRDDYDYVHHLEYINENPRKWIIGKDEYYT